jgi:hypothetical protein
MTTGFQYICYERLSKKIKDPYSYFYEVAESIMSLRRFSNLPITIKTDFPDFFNKVPTGNLTTVKINKKFKRPLFTTHEKLYQLKDLPYDNTFLVDTETIFLDNPEKLLGSNQHIQIARETRPSDKGDLALVLLKTYNTGFIVAECNKQWQKIINQAIDIFEKIKDHKRDKIFDTKVVVFPQECNVREAILVVIEKPKLILIRRSKLLENQKQKHNFPLHYLGLSPIEGKNFFKEAFNSSKELHKKN